MQLCSSVSLSLQSQKGGCLNKAGLIEASPPPSLCPGHSDVGGQIFQLKGTETQTHDSGPESVTQGRPTSVKGLQVSPANLICSIRPSKLSMYSKRLNSLKLIR